MCIRVHLHPCTRMPAHALVHVHACTHTCSQTHVHTCTSIYPRHVRSAPPRQGTLAPWSTLPRPGSGALLQGNAAASSTLRWGREGTRGALRPSYEPHPSPSTPTEKQPSCLRQISPCFTGVQGFICCECVPWGMCVWSARWGVCRVPRECVHRGVCLGGASLMEDTSRLFPASPVSPSTFTSSLRLTHSRSLEGGPDGTCDTPNVWFPSTHHQLTREEL